jgi:methionine-rich copper-binding protein CopC
MAMAFVGLSVPPHHAIKAHQAGNDRPGVGAMPQIGTKTMRSIGIIRLAAAMIAVLMSPALPLKAPSAEAASTGIVSTYPKANDVVYGSTVQISLGFEVPVDHERSTLLLKSDLGDRQLCPRLESAPNYLSGIAGHLAPGAYELIWVARLSDGRTSTGTLPFTLKSTPATAEGSNMRS